MAVKEAHVGTVLTIDLNAIRDNCRFGANQLFETKPSVRVIGAIGIGALLAGAINVRPDEKVCAVLTGGNWDLCDLAEIYRPA